VADSGYVVDPGYAVDWGVYRLTLPGILVFD
jgi:hypothetical protein